LSDNFGAGLKRNPRLSDNFAYGSKKKAATRL
jgi:hypothetical protein